MTSSPLIGQSLVSRGEGEISLSNKQINQLLINLRKEEVTVADLMRHEAGLAAFDTR